MNAMNEASPFSFSFFYVERCWFDSLVIGVILFFVWGKEKRGYLCDDVFMDGPYRSLLGPTR
jgi:hypothetical protein